MQGAGTLGVAKSVAREWPHLRVKCVDVAPDLGLLQWISQVIGEIDNPDPVTEVGFTSHGRWQLELRRDVNHPHLAELELGEDAVLLVTGGACGITAETTKALAKHRRLRLVLVGRSAIPQPEPASTRDIVDAGGLRHFLINEHRAKSAKVKPAEIEADLKRILKERQIRCNVRALEDAGAEIAYHALDVRDSDAFAQLIDDVYSRWGRIDGVIHGAGIIEDKLIRDKSGKSFANVYFTKVSSALTLARKLRPEFLKFLVFFSSVAARFGSPGQCDYSAANEVLNKLADRLSVEWPNVRTVSVNWGPWETGMMSDELIKRFAARGIQPIPMTVGVQRFLDILRRPVREEPELVVTASLSQIAGSEHVDIEEPWQLTQSAVLQPQQAVAFS